MGIHIVEVSCFDDSPTKTLKKRLTKDRLSPLSAIFGPRPYADAFFSNTKMWHCTTFRIGLLCHCIDNVATKKTMLSNGGIIFGTYYKNVGSHNFSNRPSLS
jgi:hypothetical protein